MLTYLEAEKKVERIYELRKKRAEISALISKEVEEVVSFMKDTKNKKFMKIGDFSINYTERTKRVFDFEVVEKAIKDNIPLPKSAWRTEKYNRLFIETHKDMKLEGNKFVKVKR